MQENGEVSETFQNATTNRAAIKVLEPEERFGRILGRGPIPSISLQHVARRRKLMNWKKLLAKGYTLYAAIGFVVLIPVMSYHVVAEGLPKKLLFFLVPAYALLAWSFFAVFRAIRLK
jgi:hypothetical protein